MHQPPELPEHVDEDLCSPERLVGRAGREDYVIKVAQQAQRHPWGAQETDAVANHLGEKPWGQ